MVFDRFYKGDKSRSRDKNGMGLGLYLVRTILKLHGGDIHVSSVPGEFCRFEFTIPKPPEPPKLKEGKQKEGKRRPDKPDKHEKHDKHERSKDDDGHGK